MNQSTNLNKNLKEIKERNYSKNEAKKIKSDNFTRAKREKSNIAIND